MMDTVGRHLLVDLWDCNRDLVSRREVVFHQFEPYGVSGVVIIAESHLTIHSFPEQSRQNFL